VAGTALWFAIVLRYDFTLPPGNESLFALYGLVYMFICAVFYWKLNLHRNIWRYTTARDLIRFCYATVFAIITGGVILTVTTGLANFPRSVFIILPLLQIAASAIPRIILRLWHDKVFQTALKSRKEQDNILLIGVNDAADLFVRESRRQKPMKHNIVGATDEESAQKGRLFHGIPVFGTIAELPKILRDLDRKNHPVKMLIIAEAKGEKLKQVVDTATSLNIQVKRIPTISNLKDGKKLTDLKPVLIEDLLGRNTVQLDNSSIAASLKDKTVLVTGAGGSIGRELCKQIALHKPAHMLLLDHGEDALYHIDMEFNKTLANIKHTNLLIDIKNKEDIAQALSEYNPSIIFHAAAYKHVPMIEANPISGIENNLLGTITLTDAAIENNVAKMVMVSTDKAVNPTNVMGATKRAAEMYALSASKGTNTEVMAVRFGNVLGSNGSVIPLFKRQIIEGGPLTVTHKDATRYFMTIPEASGLILQAAAKGKNGNLFMLDMGESVKIMHLAEQMIRLSGLEPYDDIDIEVTGLRPGEKLFEELWYNEEGMEKTSMEKTFLVNPNSLTPQETNKKIKAIRQACIEENAFLAVQRLKELVKEYQPAHNSPYTALRDDKIKDSA
ncbi:MAG: FlaA1/EpsC-like NDP-sugar epimerase, partial [bacterium]